MAADEPSAFSLQPSAVQAPILIIGAGLTGLAAAWELQQRGVPYVLLEAGDSFGGKVQSEATEDGFLVEKAADAFILGKPWALELAREVGLEPELIHPREDTKKLYFLRGGKLLDFPQNLKMFVPMDDDSFLQSGVLSPEGLRRMLDEQHIPPKPPTDEDESLADFITRRFGAEAMSFIVPLAAGIYVANPHELSMKAAFPQFLALEQKYGSVIAGSRATPRVQGPIFGSFKGGMSALANAVAAKLTGDVRLNTPVLAVHPDGVTVTGGEKIAGSGVILTTPAWYTAPMLQQSFPEASALVGELRANGSVAVVLAYHADQFPRDMHLHGLQVAADEGIHMKAITVHSAKMHGRAPENHVLMRVFFKDLEPQLALAEAKKEVARLFGATSEPLWHTYADWRGKNPAYQVGHLEQLARIRAALPSNVRVAGASFTGVGIPDCANAGRTAAREVAALVSRR